MKKNCMYVLELYFSFSVYTILVHFTVKLEQKYFQVIYLLFNWIPRIIIVCDGLVLYILCKILENKTKYENMCSLLGTNGINYTQILICMLLYSFHSKETNFNIYYFNIFYKYLHLLFLKFNVTKLYII